MPLGLGLGAPARMAKLKKEERQAKQSRSGKTKREHLAELIEKVKKAGGPDLGAQGWKCELRPSGKAAAGNDDGGLDPVYIDADGTEFFGRKEVLRHFGLRKSEPPPLTRKEAAERARSFCKEAATSDPLPIKLGPLTVRSLGKIEYLRDTFHSTRHLWPIGYKSTWKAAESDVLFESEVLDGAAVGDVGGIGEIDGPIFMVTVKKPGEHPKDHFGRSAKEAWRKALDNDKAEERFGFREHEVRKRVEGLRHAFDCVNYEFLELRHQNGEDGRKDAKGKDGRKGSAGAKGGKGPPAAKRGGKKDERARVRKAKEEETKRAKEEAAEKRRLAAEETARKKREEKQLQEQEQRWNSRYPIEDMAVDLEAEVLAKTDEAGHDVSAQRTAARAVVEAVERGLSRGAALEVAMAAARRVGEGEGMEEALEGAKEEAEEWVHAHAGEDAMEVDGEGVCRDANRCYHPGARVRMLFSQDGKNVWYQGFIHSVAPETKTMSIGFYDGEKQDVPYADGDVEVLDQGALALPTPVYSCTRVHPRCGDVLNIHSFVDSFRSEPFGLPRCSLQDLMEALAAPAASPLVSDLYVALLALAMQAAQHQGMVIPLAWLAESTLNQYTWPELARRWFVCGPSQLTLRKSWPEAVAAAQTLPNAACGAKTLPEGHIMMVTCLIDDALDHPELRKAIDHRLDAADELRRNLLQKNKEFAEEEKQRQKTKAVQPAANGNAGGGEEEEDEEEPTLEIPEDLLERNDEEARGEVLELHDEFEREHAAWEKRKHSKVRAEERRREEAEREERRFYERHEKLEQDTQAKIERNVTRHAPIGQDRNHNKYWWFPADKGCVYVEPPLPTNTPAGAPPAEWRILRGEEEVALVLRALREEKGVREAELARNLRKVQEKMAGAGGSVQPGVQRGTEEGKQGVFQAEVEALVAAQQEAKNVAEILDEEQRAGMEARFAGWEEAMGRTLTCEELSRLLLALEDAVTFSIAPNKRIRNQHAQALIYPAQPPPALPQDGAQSQMAVEGEQEPATAAGGEGGATTDVNGVGEGGEKLTAAQQGWLEEGSEYVGRRTRRLVKGDDGKPAGHANGRIVGWLPADISDFVCKETGQPAALWRVEFDDEDIGEEDLELHEVEAAVAAYSALHAALSSSSRPSAQKPAEDAPDGTAGAMEELGFADEGVVDMVEAHNKATKRSLWTSSLQREAWRTEVRQAGRLRSLPRVCYSSAVLCDNVLRVFSRTRDSLTSAPRRRPKRTRSEVDTSLLLGITESGRKVRKVSYVEQSSAGEEFDDDE